MQTLVAPVVLSVPVTPVATVPAPVCIPFLPFTLLTPMQATTTKPKPVRKPRKKAVAPEPEQPE